MSPFFSGMAMGLFPIALLLCLLTVQVASSPGHHHFPWSQPNGAKSIIPHQRISFSPSKTRFTNPISSRKTLNFAELELGSVVISGNSTLFSQNGSFQLGFFTPDRGSNWFIGIWYSTIPIRTYVWVANRQNPVKNPTSATLTLTKDGRLKIIDSDQVAVWQTENVETATEVKLLDTGNLVLSSPKGTIVWQSFDFPADTWLPGMNITRRQTITCWRSTSDPSPGNYSLRLKPPEYGEFELVFNGNETYWSTGGWTGTAFSGVPEMTVRYIYSFRFLNPFTPSASFTYETLPEFGTTLLTRFFVDNYGQLKQYTWSSQSENWNMFWSRPENGCRVYALCGNLGFCSSRSLRPCQCIAGFVPADDQAWKSGYFNGGCRRDDQNLCEENDLFKEVGGVDFDVGSSVSFSGSLSFCKDSCLKNCSCVGVKHDKKSSVCKNIYGSILNLRNLTNDGTEEGTLYVRIRRERRESGREKNKKNWRVMASAVIASVCAIVVSTMVVLVLILLRMRKSRGKKKLEEEIAFPVTNLKVFSYKELHSATQGFTEKLGHGGFGAVFRGTLPDTSTVAVKRLEHPGGREKEFRAEVCTIGNIQHVNLVRLRGFCLENSHRLLVYEYMQNGPLSTFLKRQGGQNLSWDVRFRIAIGTARGIAYLHEECRDCIVHCDIKPENILLDSEFTAKVSDFGMAKLIGRDFSRVLTTMRGTWGYVAPEWISGVAITAKADVYSFGMTLLEILGGRRNVETAPCGSRGKEEEEEEEEEETGGGEIVEDPWFFPPWAARKIVEDEVSAVLDDRLQGEYDPVEARRVAFVAVWCIQDNESARPTMGMVVKMLEGTVKVTVPPLPQLLQALVSGDSFHGVGTVSGQEPSSASAACSLDSNNISDVSLS